MNTEVLQRFFDCCVGSWVTERTYHHLKRQEIERSRTEFTIKLLIPEQKIKVFTDNQYPTPPDLDILPGFNLGFYTISETGEEVSQNLNILFVPKLVNESYIEGDYLRDRAYEEDRPIISDFRFDLQSSELLMTTNYSRVIAIDSITLINPNLRIRKIITYLRLPDGNRSDEVVLAGFGVEQKVIDN